MPGGHQALAAPTAVDRGQETRALSLRVTCCFLGRGHEDSGTEQEGAHLAASAPCLPGTATPAQGPVFPHPRTGPSVRGYAVRKSQVPFFPLLGRLLRFPGNRPISTGSFQGSCPQGLAFAFSVGVFRSVVASPEGSPSVCPRGPWVSVPSDPGTPCQQLLPKDLKSLLDALFYFSTPPPVFETSEPLQYLR